MEFRLGSASNVRLCFVSTFRLNVPFERERDSASVLLGAYGGWKENVVSKLKKESGSYSLSWSAPNERSSVQQNFTTGCFLESSVKDLNEYTSILSKLDVFDGLSPKITFLEIRLWEFGFGSVRVGVSFASLESDKIIEIEEKKIIDALKKENFYLKLESLIESDIICRCRSGDESDSSSQSFAEKVRQYEGKKIEQQVGKLSESLVLVEFNVEDSEFSNQSNLLSKSLYDVSTDKKLSVDNFGMLFSEDRDVIVFLGVDDDSSKNIAERIFVQVSFLQYVCTIWEMYEMFSVANLRRLNRIKSLKPIKINKLYPRGRESIIVEERRMVNSIHEEIECISMAMSKSDYLINSRLTSDTNIKTNNILNCVSGALNLDAWQNIAAKKYNSVEAQYRKIDKIASDEASTGQARSYNLAGVLIFLFIFFLRGYYENMENYNNITRDRIIPLALLSIILLYVSRAFISYGVAWTSVKIEIFKHKKSKNPVSLSEDRLWILMKQESRWDRVIYGLCLPTNRILHLLLLCVQFVDWMFKIIVVIAILYLLTIGNPQTPVPKNPKTPSNTPTTIDTSLSPKIHVPELPISTTTTLQTTTTLPPEMQSTPPPPRQSMCPKRFFHFKQCQSAGFFGDRE